MVTPRLALGLGLALSIGFSGIAAQQKSDAPNPTNVQYVQLRLAANAAVYRQGEVIPITLSFTSRVPNRYSINEATYDRSGRMGYEHFLVEPSSGIADPLQVYFDSLGSIFGGGLTNFEFLSDTPYIIHLNLNEWVRFDRPGNYRVTVQSYRVGDTSIKGVDGSNPLQSNSINFQIVEPDLTWQQSQLGKILADFDASPPTRPFTSNPKRLAAITALRYLGSVDGARELARHLRGDEPQVDFECMFGLVSSPNRLAGYDELKRLLIAPDFPVSDTFLNALSVLALNPTQPAEALRQQRVANWKDALSALMAAIPSKLGHAAAASINTALLGASISKDSGVSDQDRSKLVPLLVAHFGELTLEQQQRWLGDQWPKVKGPAWLPIVRPIATAYTDFPEPTTFPAHDYLTLSASALMRWYELDPVGARPTVLSEIVRTKPRYSAAILGVLPDATLQNEEHTIADHFLATDDYIIEGNLASLLKRYADASVLAEVLPKIERKTGDWACDPQNDAVAYVQKVAPEQGKRLLERVTPQCRSLNDSSVRR
jgi:hypothetical protein